MNDMTSHIHQIAPDTESVQSTGKKKISWTRTILWMLSMVLLLNVVMGIIAYVLHRMQFFFLPVD